MTKISNILIKSNRTELNEKTIGSCFSHQCTIVKTALMKKNLFNLEYKYAADFDFFIKMLKKKKKFIYIKNIISINIAGGISDSNQIKVLNEFRKIIFKENLKFIKLIRFGFYFFLILLNTLIKSILPNWITNKFIILK